MAFSTLIGSYEYRTHVLALQGSSSTNQTSTHVPSLKTKHVHVFRPKNKAQEMMSISSILSDPNEDMSTHETSGEDTDDEDGIDPIQKSDRVLEHALVRICTRN